MRPHRIPRLRLEPTRHEGQRVALRVLIGEIGVLVVGEAVRDEQVIGLVGRINSTKRV